MTPAMLGSTYDPRQCVAVVWPPRQHKTSVHDHGTRALAAGIHLGLQEQPVGVKGWSGIAQTGDLPNGL
jgi:hypothetical protein